MSERQTTAVLSRTLAYARRVELSSNAIAGLVVAILGGAAVGVERQRSGHATGPKARLGGIRTFTLLGTLAGLTGLLIDSDIAVPGSLLVAGALLLILVGYIRASPARHRRDH